MSNEEVISYTLPQQEGENLSLNIENKATNVIMEFYNKINHIIR
jgi:hypothetical protein